MKKHFITGLVILLPLALTLAVLIFLFNLLTEPFVGIVQAIFVRYDIFANGFLFFSAAQIQTVTAQILILLFLFYFTVGLGAIARHFFINYIIRLWEYVLHRIPVVSSIYKTCQEVITTIFADKNNSFKQVVLVPFPGKDSRCIGMITSDNVEGLGTPEGKTYVAVYVPTTPNPTSGYLMFFEREDLIYLDMKVETAFKYIISCGVIPTTFNPLLESKEEDKL